MKADLNRRLARLEEATRSLADAQKREEHARKELDWMRQQGLGFLLEQIDPTLPLETQASQSIWAFSAWLSGMTLEELERQRNPRLELKGGDSR